MESSNSAENYIKGIYRLSGEKHDWVNTNDLAVVMKVKPSSITDMIQKLNQKKLVEYQKYKGVRLSKEGKAIALDVIRKHRLWEVFLKEKLAFEWDEVHEIAEQLEHISSPELVKRLDKYLDYPKFDPHGDPIPDVNGKINPGKRLLLSAFKVDEIGDLVGVNDSNPPFLKFLESKSLLLGSVIKVRKVHAYDQSMEIQIKGQKLTINVSKEVAGNLYLIKNV